MKLDSNYKCQLCDGITTQAFDENGYIKRICLNPNCQHEFYSDDSLEKIRSNNNKQKFLQKFEQIKNDILEEKYYFIYISNLKALREYRGISQVDMAEVFGFKQQRYGAIERNTNATSIILVSMIATLLGVSLDDTFRCMRIPKKLYDEIKYLNTDFTINNEYINHIEVANKLESEYELLFNKAIENLSDKTLDKKNIYQLITKEYKDKLVNIEKQIKEEKDAIAKINRSSSLLLRQERIVEHAIWEEILKRFDCKDVKELTYDSILEEVYR